MEKHQVLEQQQSSPSRQTPAPDYDQEVDGLEQIVDIRVFLTWSSGEHAPSEPRQESCSCEGHLGQVG